MSACKRKLCWEGAARGWIHVSGDWFCDVLWQLGIVCWWRTSDDGPQEQPDWGPRKIQQTGEHTDQIVPVSWARSHSHQRRKPPKGTWQTLGDGWLWPSFTATIPIPFGLYTGTGWNPAPATFHSFTRSHWGPGMCPSAQQPLARILASYSLSPGSASSSCPLWVPFLWRSAHNMPVFWKPWSLGGR